MTIIYIFTLMLISGQPLIPSLDNWVYCTLWEPGKWQFSEPIPFWQSFKNPNCKPFFVPWGSNQVFKPRKQEEWVKYSPNSGRNKSLSHPLEEVPINFYG